MVNVILHSILLFVYNHAFRCGLLIKDRLNNKIQMFALKCFSGGSTLIAWMPDEFSPAHNILGREVRSGIAPLGRNYARTEAVRSNQIVRAGFIR